GGPATAAIHASQPCVAAGPVAAGLSGRAALAPGRPAVGAAHANAVQAVSNEHVMGACTHGAAVARALVSIVAARARPAAQAAEVELAAVVTLRLRAVPAAAAAGVPVARPTGAAGCHAARALIPPGAP